MARKKGDKPDLLTKEEMDKLLMSVSHDIYFVCLYNILLHTGRRIGEIYGTKRGNKTIGGVKVKDIDFDENTMTTNILKTKKRKLTIICEHCKHKNTHKNICCGQCGKPLPAINPENLKYDIAETKTISLKPQLAVLLKSYIKSADLTPTKILFHERSLSYIKKSIKKHIKDAGIQKKYSIHGFRHYFVTQCKRDNMTNDQIALWTGHKNPNTLNLYNRMVPKDIEKRIMEVEL